MASSSPNNNATDGNHTPNEFSDQATSSARPRRSAEARRLPNRFQDHVVPSIAPVTRQQTDHDERHSIELLNRTDRRLYDGCVRNNIQFLWPTSSTGRSADEHPQDTTNRQQFIRNLLSNCRDNRSNSSRREVADMIHQSSSQSTESIASTNPQVQQLPKHLARAMESILGGLQIVQSQSCGYRYSGQNPVNVCSACFALRWNNELNSICCSNGKVKIPPFPTPPPLLCNLWKGTDERSQIFREFARSLNNALALTSQKVQHKILRGSQWAPSVIIQGKVHHHIGPLERRGEAQPRFAQIWVFDPAHEKEECNVRLANMRLPHGTSLHKQQILSSLLLDLQRMLQSNPYIRDFKMACEIPETEFTQANFVISASARPQHGHARVYNRHFNEIAVLINNQGGATDINLQRRSGGLKRISDTHRSYDPLFFVLLHPLGNDGWHLELKKGVEGGPQSRLTCMDFYGYHLHTRFGVEQYLHRGCRLFQEWCCIQEAKAENQTLFYARTHQKELRADLYNNIVDAVDRHDTFGQEQGAVINVGRRIICPPSIIGSPRDMHRRFLDSTAVVRVYGGPTFFITFTCNPTWDEIIEEIYPGQQPFDRPDITARVFKLKKDELTQEIVKGEIFGAVSAFMEVVEFQKRGLPHVHILTIMKEEHRVWTADDVDKIVCAELPPDPNQYPEGSPARKQAEELQELVIRHHRHGPCGALNPTNVCMYDKEGNLTTVCQKGFPKSFQPYTEWSETEFYPIYRRRSPFDGGRSIITPFGTLDNRWIVPYSPYLVLRYKAHVNVEIPIGPFAAKYLYKYTTKGSDRSMVAIQREGQRDEIQEYQDLRSIGSSEACWRLLSFPLFDRYPAVYALRLHLPNQQFITYREGEEREVVLRDDESRRTELTEFFTYNRKHPYTRCSYVNMPRFYVWHKKEKQWKPRLRQFDTIGRIHSVHPVSGDLFYLRMLLHHKHSEGAQSFEDLYRVRGQQQPSYQAVCRQLGLLDDDDEWNEILLEAAHTKMCPQIRELFVTLLIFCQIADPQELFENHHSCWYDDFSRKTRNQDPILGRAFVLLDIERRLQERGKHLEDFQLPLVDDCLRERIKQLMNQTYQSGHRITAEIEAETLYNPEDLRKYVEEKLPQLTPSQRSVYDAVIHAVKHNTGKNFFIDARGGTGKTFLENTILASVRLMSLGAIALAVASSGIAAMLLLQGRTFHSRFKAPLNIKSTDVLNIPRQSATAELIKKSSLIVWDEAPMNHRFLLEALDRTLRDIMHLPHTPFGGKVILLAGDFRQVLPVIKNGSRAEIVNASMKRSHLWPLFQTFTLQENMRVLKYGKSNELKEFDEWLLGLGNGTLRPCIPDTDMISLPSQRCIPINGESRDTLKSSMNSLIDKIFPNLIRQYRDRHWISERAILSPKNREVDEINAHCISLLPGDTITCSSADTTIDEDDSTLYTPEFLNSLTTPGMPPHELILKPLIPLILLRNINPNEGLCNGTKIILLSVIGRMLRCVIAGGLHDGREVLIPRIIFTPNEEDHSAIKWQRRQFPVRPAFALTINKSQGQTLSCVGVWLQEPVFTHGQLYVAASRVGHPNHITFAVRQKEGFPPTATRNVVYREIFD